MGKVQRRFRCQMWVWFSLISFIIFCCLKRKYTMASYYQNIIQIPHRNILKRCRMKSFLIMQIMYLTSFHLQPMQLELNLYIQFTKATRLCFMYLRCFLIHLRINNRWFDDPNKKKHNHIFSTKTTFLCYPNKNVQQQQKWLLTDNQNST